MAEIKISELSIGDWVVLENQPFKVIGINPPYVDLLGNGNRLRLSDIDNDNLSPIPLTPEILKENGFEDNCGRWYNSEARMEFERYKDGWCRTINCGEYSVYFIKYVHQLQHALRLAGVEKDIEI